MKTRSAEHVLPMFRACSFHGNSMNNLWSYCGLVDAKKSASEKDLHVFLSLLLKCTQIFWSNSSISVSKREFLKINCEHTFDFHSITTVRVETGSKFLLS